MTTTYQKLNILGYLVNDTTSTHISTSLAVTPTPFCILLLLFISCPSHFGSQHNHQHLTTFFGTARAAFYGEDVYMDKSYCLFFKEKVHTKPSTI